VHGDRPVGVLEALGLLAGPVQPFDGGVQVDGERDRGHGDLVAGAVVAEAAHADGDHRFERLGRRVLAAVLEQCSDRACDGGEADVVECAADAARPPQLVAPGVVADERATRADRSVERTRRRRGQDFLGGRAEYAPGAPHGMCHGRLRGRGRGRPGAQRADAIGEGPRDGVQPPADASGAPLGLPGDRGLGRRTGLGVKDQADDLQRGEPVDERVMDLAHHPHPPVLESGHQKDLPQRP
jgi:hypothetical protein